MIRPWKKFLIAIGSGSICVSPLWAWPDDRTGVRTLYRDALTVHMNNSARATATIIIKVSATLTIQENGNANWPDDRNCHFVNVRRVLTRELSLTMADGTVVPVRDTTVSLPAGTEKHWAKVNPCNDHVGGVDAYLSDQIGDAATWQTYIDGQKADARKILAQFGEVI